MSTGNVHAQDESVISAQLGDFSTVAYAVQTGAYGFQTLLGDGFMVRQFRSLHWFHKELLIPRLLVSTDLPYVHGLGEISAHLRPGDSDVAGQHRSV